MVDVRILLTLAIATPAVTALAVLRLNRERTRPAACAAAAVSLCTSAAMAYGSSTGAWAAEAVSPFTPAPMTLYSLLALVTLMLAPKRDLEGRKGAGFLLILAGTLGAYAATALPWFLAAWAVSAVPHVSRWFSERNAHRQSRAPQIALAGSTAALAVGTVLTAWWPSEGTGELRGFLLLILAALLRKGIFPFHSWVARCHEDGLPQAAALLLNGHLGAFLIVRFVAPQLGEASRLAVPLLGDLALFTAVYVSLLGLVERKPRRILAFLSVSQAAFIFAGLENPSPVGITGALVHWPVVALAVTGLVAVYAALEARFPAAEHTQEFLGLGTSAPRLAVFFAAFGFALAGLPGTLGFAAEDMLFHGTLETSPFLGIALPVATAFNGISMFRLFSMLFLGQRSNLAAQIPDALPRERWALTGAILALVAGGLLPRLVIQVVEPSVEAVARILGRS